MTFASSAFRPLPRTLSRALWTVALASALAACGGGGGGTSEPEASTPPGNSTPVDPAPPISSPVADGVRLSWSAPMSDGDGQALRDLAGFRIYYGTVSGQYPSNVTINDPAATQYVFKSLPAGTYFFAVAAFDALNNESANSSEVSKTLK